MNSPVEEIDGSVKATRFAPSRIEGDRSCGCLPAAWNDWHRVGRLRVGTGLCEPTTDIGYTTARVTHKQKLSFSFLLLRGSLYTTG